ncbi:MAG: hypothetical protein ABI868_16185 [Acidobacteriota bacterium]
MGNVSRNTFDPLKDYVAVRLQQGVPVLDADWNELNDVTRQELYDALSLTFTDGVQPHGFDLEVGSRSEPNDFGVLAGAALIQGRPVRLRKNVRYSTQPWTDPKRAARDGVAVIPPLTTPAGPPEGAPPRLDIVYLDVWDREVLSDEDTSLINPAIGVETCTRLKREAAVRVAEGTTTMPAAPGGHLFLPLARLRRPVNQPLIFNIDSLRPYLATPQGTRLVSFFPAFLPISTVPGFAQKLPEWRIGMSILTNPIGFEIPKFRAIKPQADASVGLLPLSLPDGAALTGIQIGGTIEAVNAQLQWQLVRISQQVFVAGTQADANRFYDILYEDTIRATSPQQSFGTSYGLTHLDLEKRTVNNALYQYVLFAKTFTTPGPYFATIHGVSIIYENYGPAGQPTHDHD